MSSTPEKMQEEFMEEGLASKDQKIVLKEKRLMELDAKYKAKTITV